MNDAGSGVAQEQVGTFLSLFPMPAASIDWAGRAFRGNRQFHAMFGHTPEEVPTLEAWHLRAYPDPAYRKAVVSTWEAGVSLALRTGTDIPPLEVRITCKDGTVRVVMMACIAAQDKVTVLFNDQCRSDAPPVVCSPGREAAERVRLEQKLHDLEDLLNGVFDESPYPSWISDANGNLIRINQSCCRLLGIVEEDVIGRYNVFEDAQVIAQGLVPLVRTAFEEGKRIGFDMTYEASHIVRESHGSYPFITIMVTMIPIKNAKGKVRNVLVQHVDITARRQAEEALRKSEERFLGMAEQLLDVLFQTDAAGKLTYLSPSVTHMLGWSPDEVLGEHAALLLTVQDAECVARVIREVAESGTPVRNLALTLKRKDGSTLSGEITVSRAVRGDAVQGTLGLIRDITEREQAAQERERLEGRLRQAQKMEAIGQLAGGIAHDFNNLLQVILGQVDVSEQMVEPDSRATGVFGEVRRATERAAELTRQLLAFSRRQIISPMDLDLNELVQNVLKMVRRVIGEHIHLRFKPGRDLGTVHVDSGQIDQVLMNLCVNARDAMPNGGTLTIETQGMTIDEEYCREHVEATPGRYVLLRVTDTGCGMDEETRLQIFDPFFTTKGMGQGTGLGLATVYGIVKQHDGLIDVYSEPNAGTVFNIYIPSVERPAEEIAPPVEAPATGGKEAILVAEDEESVRRIVSRMLKMSGYTVFEAADGEEALRVFEEHRDTISLALLDIIMPKLGGRAVMDHIQATCPSVRFLFSSGYSESAIHTNFVIKEGLHLISKPYHKADLLRAVRGILDKDVASGAR